MATLTVRNLARRFEDEVVALHDVSLTVEDGRVAALFGPSGCGKTTVLRLISGLDRPDSGEVLLDGVSVLGRPPHRRGVGLMFQELALFPHLTVSQNIEFGLRMAKWPRAARQTRISQLLTLVGLPGFGRRAIHELSGGERQRVALARTLAPEPQVLLLDEPLGALDEELKQDLRVHLREVLRRLRTTALIVSHDLRDAAAVADDIVVMGEGMVLQAGPLSHVLAHPASVRVAHMLGYVTLAAGALEGGRLVEDGVGAVDTPPGFASSGEARVLAHPSSLLAVPAGRGLGCGVEGRVVANRPDGPLPLLDVSLGRRRIVQVRWEWDVVAPPDGETVALAARPDTLRFFRPVDHWEPPRSRPAPNGQDVPEGEDDRDDETPAGLEAAGGGAGQAADGGRVPPSEPAGAGETGERRAR